MSLLSFQTSPRGLLDITTAVRSVVQSSPDETGVCTLFIQHTSASLLIQENADPDVRADLQAFFQAIAPERPPWGPYKHADEGPDDMPAHIRASLLPVSVSVPYVNRRLCLGVWQAIYIFEHRAAPHNRSVCVHV